MTKEQFINAHPNIEINNAIKKSLVKVLFDTSSGTCAISITLILFIWYILATSPLNTCAIEFAILAESSGSESVTDILSISVFSYASTATFCPSSSAV